MDELKRLVASSRGLLQELVEEDVTSFERLELASPAPTRTPVPSLEARPARSRAIEIV
ncbi:MAG: hypothetical protein JRG86_02430, partial [Deltaproteobacteria bacterium]|nr:hypothetical protein [Deltaproteobacteria bacterium]